MVRAMDTAGELPPEHRAEIEAGKILDHLHRYGATRSPRMEDQITRHLMTHRWSYRAWAAMVQKSDLQWWRRDFVRAYTAQAAMVEGGGGLPLGKLAQSITQSEGLQRG